MHELLVAVSEGGRCARRDFFAGWVDRDGCGGGLCTKLYLNLVAGTDGGGGVTE